MRGHRRLGRPAGQVGRAITQVRQLLDDRTRILGPDHPDTLVTRSNLAAWLAEAGQAGQAITQARQLLDDRTRILGPDHPDTLRTRSHLASWLGEAGQVDQAITQVRQLRALWRRVRRRAAARRGRAAAGSAQSPGAGR